MTNLVGKRIGGLIDHRGRVYLTENHLCFSSNIIGIKTKFVSGLFWFAAGSLLSSAILIDTAQIAV